MELNDVTLMRLDDDRIVTIDGVKYIVITNPKTKTQSKPKAKRQYVRATQAREAILKILEETPNLRRNQIEDGLKKHGLELSNNSLGAVLNKMKHEGKIKINGKTNNAHWALNSEYINVSDPHPMQAVV